MSRTSQETNAPEPLDLAEESGPGAPEVDMVEGLSVAGKHPADLSIDALLQRRQALIAALEALDGHLERRFGVRAVYKPAGAPRTVSLRLAAALADGPKDTATIAAKTGQTLHACAQMLSKLVLAGQLRRIDRGLYALPEAS